jgi:hypothetical protein
VNEDDPSTPSRVSEEVVQVHHEPCGSTSMSTGEHPAREGGENRGAAGPYRRASTTEACCFEGEVEAAVRAHYRDPPRLPEGANSRAKLSTSSPGDPASSASDGEDVLVSQGRPRNGESEVVHGVMLSLLPGLPIEEGGAIY